MLIDFPLRVPGHPLRFRPRTWFYKPLAVRVALIAGFRRAMPVFKSMIVVAVAVVMWESLQGFPRGVGRVESRLLGFPYPGISMAGLTAVPFKSPDLADGVRIESSYANLIRWPPDRRRYDSRHGAG